MSSILLVTSSPRGAESISSKVAGELATALARGGKVTVRDLGSNPIPHIDSVVTSAIRKAPADRTPEEAAAADYSDKLVAELKAADTIVLATGLINFGLYSTLKSWIDNIARAGSTFRYTETGPEGLVTGKKVYIVLASGGIYSEGPGVAVNHAVPYLKTVLGFIGLTDVETIFVEGLAFGPEAAEKALAAAKAKTEALASAA
ncbi:FMN-dependent NADH-azoreductase [Rhizobiaceae bacterium BDR2-2]|uniref:FMN dependent NADH:quinone oxidoreductase n=1 Tax=Ectorhizobium quercum TaxID=2965071 RepID=A0AAE3N1B6_9HYPH|nr:FMN-dependent NADH-azoreductase [Ectorhizobium quercum]MCX8998086.1 FMN-dependent NADH-azoreductase [Ectorhizobium quercum]